MAVEFKMPQLGESVVEGTISKWLKQEGDRVEEYEPLLEVATDKVDTEVPSPVAGVLLEIRAGEGESVRVGEVIAVLGEADEAIAARVEPEAEVGEPLPPERDAAAVLHQRAAPVATASGEHPVGRSYLTPVVARIAAEEGVDLSQVEGTGRHGRITKKDIQAYLEERKEEPAMAETARAARAAEAPAAAAREPAPGPAAAPATGTLVEGDETVRLSRMRQATARHMRLSKDTAAHVTTFFEVDLSQVVRHRQANKDAFAAKGVRLTFVPYFVEALVEGVKKYPMLNAVFDDETMIFKHVVNIGMAVDLGEEGLIVPVIKNADEKNLLGLAREVEDLAGRARAGNLAPDDVRGGTISVTNHGVMGSLAGTPIIPMPQVAIMGIGAIQKRAVVIEDEFGDSIAIHPMVYLSLSFDHRAIDGATADRFMMVVKSYLEGYVG